MPQFVRRPVVVDAVRFVMSEARERVKGRGLDLDTGASFVANNLAVVLTRAGQAPVSDGDYIVTYADGSTEVWRPSAFLATWEQVTA
jgi:hypothetical protein